MLHECANSAFFKKPKLAFGGNAASRKRKERRPLSTNLPIHLVLKASQEILPSDSGIIFHTMRLSPRFKVRVYSVAVAEDHVHAVIKIPSRASYNGFIRALTGLLARKLGIGLWKQTPYTRIATWGRDFQNLLRYLEKNRSEAAGGIPYEPRNKKKRRPAMRP